MLMTSANICTMIMKLFHILVIVSILTVPYYLFSVGQNVQLIFLINRNLTNITETRSFTQEIPPCDCCLKQSDWNEDFLRIPKRLHQTYKTDQIPEQYMPLIRSWLDNHPDWEYYFWSDKEAACLIKDFYPEYIHLYGKYSHKLQRSDAIRYFILHRYGGVYADMDVLSLRPMEEFLRTNTCVLTPEPFLQTKLLFDQPSLITNCIMASAACHPFLNYVMEGLHTAYRDIKSIHEILLTTGPIFLNETYYNYLKTQSNDLDLDPRKVYIADFKYLVPRFDIRLQETKFTKYCRSRKKKSSLHKEACEELAKTNFSNVLPEEAYTDHLWLHLGYDESNIKKTQPIHTLNKRVKRYGSCDFV